MAVSETVTSLETLNEGLAKLRTSTLRTLPIFLMGILATLVAAGVALFYILTLSADLREARAALGESQAALMDARAKLVDVNSALQGAQDKAATAADAESIATAISDVSRSQASITAASSSINDAAIKISAPERAKRPAEPARAPAGMFVTRITDDRFLSLRAEPSMASPELAKIPSGSKLKCEDAIRNVAGNWWRSCQFGDGQTGFVSDKFIQRL